MRSSSAQKAQSPKGQFQRTLLISLKTDSCSCARNDKEVKSGKHSITCEMKKTLQSAIAQKEEKLDLGKMYKKIADACGDRILSNTLPKLYESRVMRFDMDVLIGGMELGVNNFLSQCKSLRGIIAFSSLLKIDEVDELLSSKKPQDINQMHSSIAAFYERINKFKLEKKNKAASSNIRGLQLLSIDCFFNTHLIKSIQNNMTRQGNDLRELTICGINLSLSSAEALNSGLMKANVLKKLRLNFCLRQKELLMALMPALCSPNKVPIEDLNLAANGLSDSDSGELFSKIIVTHTENRDEIFWKYGLRNELPPLGAVQGLKHLDLSFNKLAEKSLSNLVYALQKDNYILSLNLRANQIENQHAVDFLSALSDNQNLFNIDLRDNIDIQQKFYRKLALKLLQNYTSVGKRTNSKVWENDQKYFNSELLVVQIPQTMIKSYAKKLENIRTMSLTTLKQKDTDSARPPRHPQSNLKPRPNKKVLKTLDTPQAKSANVLEPIKEHNHESLFSTERKLSPQRSHQRVGSGLSPSRVKQLKKKGLMRTPNSDSKLRSTSTKQNTITAEKQDLQMSDETITINMN